MDKIKFWEMLSSESKEMVNEFLNDYNGSDGVVGRIFEMYEEGASMEEMTVEEYLEDVDPNEYVEYMYDGFKERNYFKKL